MRRFFFFFLLLLTKGVFSQECGCDVVLSNLKKDSYNVIELEANSYEPGFRICIPAGNYAGLLFNNLQGSMDAYVTIVNCNGQVILSDDAYSGIIFRNSTYVRLTGTGDSDYEYGIKIENVRAPGANGVSVSDFCSDFEIDHVEIANTGFAGIIGKTDPSCGNELTWRRNGYVLKNLNIHHNYIHDTGGEGIYLGYTGGYLIESNKVCNGEYVFGHWLENIKIHDNQIERTGWDGIQLSLVRKSGKVYDNTILSYGTKGETFQKFAISSAGGDYEVYNNYIENPSHGDGEGIQLISAASGTKIFNNVIVNPKKNGIYIHNRHEFDSKVKGYLIAHNTIYRPELSGILYNTIITQSANEDVISTSQETVPSLFVNNLILEPGNDYENVNVWKESSEDYIDFFVAKTRDASLGRMKTNLFSKNPDTLCLANIESHDFRPGSENSPLVDSGTTLTADGISFDMLNNTRFVGRQFDIGAYEFQGEVLNFDCQSESEENGKNDDQQGGTYVLPNPGRGKIRFVNGTMDSTTIQIFNPDGTMIRSSTYQMGDDVDVADLSKGMYFARLECPEGPEIIKFLVW